MRRLQARIIMTLPVFRPGARELETGNGRWQTRNKPQIRAREGSCPPRDLHLLFCCCCSVCTCKKKEREVAPLFILAARASKRQPRKVSSVQARNLTGWTPCEEHRTVAEGHFFVREIWHELDCSVLSQPFSCPSASGLKMQI